MQTINTVSDVPDSFTLLHDRQEITEVYDYFDIGRDYVDEFPYLLVEVLDGDYGRIYGCNSVALDAPVFDLRAWYSLPTVEESQYPPLFRVVIVNRHGLSRGVFISTDKELAIELAEKRAASRRPAHIITVFDDAGIPVWQALHGKALRLF